MTIVRAIANAIRRGGFLLVAVIAALMAVPVAAEEVIRNFETDILVHTDASVTVTETITVDARGDAIRRGIFRDIPTVLEGPQGIAIHSELEVISVTRNGEAEPYALEPVRDGERVRIGDANVLLEPGIHQYRIRYTMDRAARSFANHDEIYWNATGNFWEFPIEEATTLVTLPEGALITDLEVFTGAQDDIGIEAAFERVSDNQARFTTTAPLAPFEGMTVVVAFEPGVLAGPQGFEALWYRLSDTRGYIVPAVLVLLVLAYNGVVWNAVGRDPRRGVIFPRFYPPKEFSPALTHYVHRMGWQNSGWLAFSAALVSLATNGYLEIDTAEKTTRLVPLKREADTALPPGEAVLFAYLRDKDEVRIDKATGPELAKRRAAFTGAIEAENRKVYFRNNWLYSIMSGVIGAGSLAIMAMTGVLDPELAFAGLFVAVFAASFVLAMRGSFRGGFFGRIPAILIGVVILALLAAAAADIFYAFTQSFPLVAAFIIVAVTVVFAILMRAPTVHGRRVMDEIEGFRMYLDTAERERLNFVDEPDMSIQRFEAILPYAMALGVEKPWSERFENDLTRHAVKDAAQGYRPRWYHGSPAIGPNALASTMGGVASGLSSAMVAAQPAKSSSSGFSGGRSGGGGGGGGGGGW